MATVIDARALEAVLAHALHRAMGHAHEDFETQAYVNGQELVGMNLQTSKLLDEAAFYLGFEITKECIVTVLSDPLGDHTKALQDICQEYKAERVNFEDDLARSKIAPEAA